MADYTIARVGDVPDMAAEVGMDPEHFEIRFMRESLGLKTWRSHTSASAAAGGHLRVIRTGEATDTGPGRGVLPHLGPGAGKVR